MGRWLMKSTSPQPLPSPSPSPSNDFRRRPFEAEPCIESKPCHLPKEKGEKGVWGWVIGA